MIRFPAGSEADAVYWDRTNTGVWYQGPAPYTRTLTAATLDSLVSLAQEVGAEPLITVNARINDKLMAADMVRYANIEKGYNIKYWEIGNEPEYYNGAFATTPAEVAVRIEEYMDAMKAVDPSIQIIGPANSQPMQMTAWTKPILSALKNNNKPVDALSVHWYPLWGGQTNTASSSYPTITNLLKYEGTNYQNSYISWANKFTDTTPTDNLVNYRNQYAPGGLIGVTELGQVTAGNEGAGIGDTLAGALWLGDVLVRLAYHKVDFATQFLMEGQQAYALMDTSKNVRPAYYLYPMLKRYFGDTLVSSASSDNQNFTIWASKRAGVNNKLYLMVLNKNQTQSLDATINLSNFAPQSTALAWEMNGPAINSTSGININGVQVPSSGTLPAIAGTSISGVGSSFTKSFPAHSITMIELTAAGTGTTVTMANAGFEAPATSNYTLGPMTSGWTFNNRAGVQRNGSAFGASTAPDGTQTAFIQSVNGVHGEISQSVTLNAGTYQLSMQAAKRTNYGGNQSIQVYLNSTLVHTITPTSGSFGAYATGTFTASAGTHTIKLKGSAPAGDQTAFVDSVVLTKIN